MKGLKFGIVVGRFNEFISSKLLGGAIDALKRHDADEHIGVVARKTVLRGILRMEARYQFTKPNQS